MGPIPLYKDPAPSVLTTRYVYAKEPPTYLPEDALIRVFIVSIGWTVKSAKDPASAPATKELNSTEEVDLVVVVVEVEGEGEDVEVEGCRCVRSTSSMGVHSGIGALEVAASRRRFLDSFRRRGDRQLEGS